MEELLPFNEPEYIANPYAYWERLHIDLTQRRALEEVPKAVSQQIIARVLSGGDDHLAIDVERLIHDALASVYRDCKTTTVAALRA